MSIRRCAPDRLSKLGLRSASDRGSAAFERSAEKLVTTHKGSQAQAGVSCGYRQVAARERPCLLWRRGHADQSRETKSGVVVDLVDPPFALFGQRQHLTQLDRTLEAGEVRGVRVIAIRVCEDELVVNRARPRVS